MITGGVVYLERTLVHAAPSQGVRSGLIDGVGGDEEIHRHVVSFRAAVAHEPPGVADVELLAGLPSS